ncbi:hypothetical protein [Nonomuraea sp. CA-141351]|uniref:hypothetical protein n=1 Tax=Nonomuraea sp. CA-141351 TaxID=3239996 RepID=UPI003D9078B3
MTPVEICRALLAGIVSAEQLPELGDDDVLQEVRYRLSQAGCDLVYSRHFDSWTASFTRGTPDGAGIDSPSLLNNADLAVLAVCWLHLRFLPAENSRLPVDDDALFASEEPQEIRLEESEVASSIPALSKTTVGISVGKLKKARFLLQRDGKLAAGPMMDTIDEVRATEQARRLMLRHQRLKQLQRQGEGPEEPSVQAEAPGGTDGAPNAAD